MEIMLNSQISSALQWSTRHKSTLQILKCIDRYGNSVEQSDLYGITWRMHKAYINTNQLIKRK